MLKNITEEMWYNETSKYRGACPNDSNSDYYSGLVNFYTCYGDNELLEDIECDTKARLEEVKESEFYQKVVKDLSYDIDSSCKIGFVDIFLNENITYDDFKSLLKYINTNFK